MKPRATFRVLLTPTTDTYLLCIHCGAFRSELAVTTGPGGATEAAVGIHRKCLREARAAQRAARARARATTQTPPPPPSTNPRDAGRMADEDALSREQRIERLAKRLGF